MLCRVEPFVHSQASPAGELAPIQRASNHPLPLCTATSPPVCPHHQHRVWHDLLKPPAPAGQRVTLFQAETGLQTGQGIPASPGAQAKENKTVLLLPTQQGGKTGMLRRHCRGAEGASRWQARPQEAVTLPSWARETLAEPHVSQG